IAAASLILFVVDVYQDITPLDKKVAEMLRHVDRPVLLVANKVDTPAQEQHVGAFYGLGFGEPIRVSALHGHNRRELLDAIMEKLGDQSATEAPVPVMKIALVGRRNVGKSTFINALAGEERVIVSEVPGTTRDSVDVRFTFDSHEFVAIDTAGVKKKNKHKTDIEYYGFTRAIASVRRADVVLFLIDATVPVSEVDKKLAEVIVNEYRPCVIVVNKWDLAKGKASAEDYAAYIEKTLPHLAYAPLAFTTAMDGRNIKPALELARSLFKQSQTRVSTGQLNRAVEAVLAEAQPQSDKHGAQPRIYYATQVSVGPPTLVLFVNSPALLREQYRRFAERRIREALPFEEVPVRLVWKARQSNEAARHAHRG
ncbi:MAG TPA: ribosome biogenesis GTPase Der, partial [Phycisphaerae bacterium]|nr:ribosome biogenesis GTPase Der [Phycisphaerae bacterium]